MCPRLRASLWVACRGGLHTDSTNDDAKRLARRGAAEGTVVVAASQGAGRGRLRRAWVSPAGGVYASVVLRPALSPSALAPIAPVVAVGAARGLTAVGCTVGLKWPNDLLLDGRKLAGILVEAAVEADRIDWVVAGIGVNVASAPHPGSACVRDAVPGVLVADVAAAVLDGVASAYRSFGAGGFPAVREEYRALGTLWGERITVRDGTGRVVTEGIAQDVDDHGTLLVVGDEGTRAVTGGEVTLAARDDLVDHP